MFLGCMWHNVDRYQLLAAFCHMHVQVNFADEEESRSLGLQARTIRAMLRAHVAVRIGVFPVAVAGTADQGHGAAGPAGLRAYGAAYFHLARDFSGVTLPADPIAGWLAGFMLEVPREMPPGLLHFLSARRGAHAGGGEGFP